MSLNLQGHYSNIIINIQSVINRGKRNKSIKSYGRVGEGKEQINNIKVASINIKLLVGII